MPNDTPDYQPGANYVAVPQPRLPIGQLTPGPFNISLSAYTSVMLAIGTGGTGVTITATWLDANGNQISTTPLTYPNTGTFYLKMPVLGPTLQLTWVSGNGVIYAFGGQEALQLATVVGDGHTPQDGTAVISLNYLGATTAGTGILLGQTVASGRCWVNWSFSNTSPGFIQGQTFRPDGTTANLNIATAAQATGFVGTTVSSWQGFVNLPPFPVSWYWVPNATNAAGQSCVLTVIKG